MIYIAHKDRRIREFCKDIVAGIDESKTITDKLSLMDLKRVNDGDTVYGSLFMSEILLPDAEFTYINIIPPRPPKQKDWKGWEYKTCKVDGNKAIVLIDENIYDIKEETDNAG